MPNRVHFQFHTQQGVYFIIVGKKKETQLTSSKTIKQGKKKSFA